MNKEDRTREWTSDAGASWLCPSKCCVFCDHCESIFWDYTNGPYMILCDLQLDPTDGGYKGECSSFAEDAQ